MTARYAERTLRQHSQQNRVFAGGIDDGLDSRQRISARHSSLPFTVFGRGSGDCTGFERRSLVDVSTPIRN